MLVRQSDNGARAMPFRRLIGLLIVVPLVLSGCGLTPGQSNQAGNGPVLSNDLIRGCEPRPQPGSIPPPPGMPPRPGAPPPGSDVAAVGIKEGVKAVDFTLKDIHGNEFTLSRLLDEKPVVMVFGSFT